MGLALIFVGGTPPTAVSGGTFNAAEFFPTGQGDVVIVLYEPSDGSTITLDSSVCTELGSTGVYIWDIANITTLPTPYKEYAYKMTDGATSESGMIYYDDFLIQYIIHEQMGI